LIWIEKEAGNRPLCFQDRKERLLVFDDDRADRASGGSFFDSTLITGSDSADSSGLAVILNRKDVRADSGATIAALAQLVEQLICNQ
jgi:hypothetical protein